MAKARPAQRVRNVQQQRKRKKKKKKKKTGKHDHTATATLWRRQVSYLTGNFAISPTDPAAEGEAEPQDEQESGPQAYLPLHT